MDEQTRAACEVPGDESHRLSNGTHAHPHGWLGCHDAEFDGRQGVVLRVLHPDAVHVSATFAHRHVELESIAYGLFAAFVEGVRCPQHPTLHFSFPDGQQWEIGDPYSHWPTLGDDDLHLFNEGSHYEIWKVLGARHRQHEGVWGTAFAVWAPNAVAVSVVGDFNHWDRRLLPMRAMGSSGIFELFVPGVAPGSRYQFDIVTRDGQVLRKSDPFAEAADHPPARASIVTAESQYAWGDAAHMKYRGEHDIRALPMSVYEVHLGSYRRGPDGNPLGYRQLADAIIPHMQHFGFTHLELLPVSEHPFDGSWGYQVTGFYAPTCRYGSPDDFRYLVDQCHQAGIGVIIDWVPAHFPKDDFALARFDGTPLFEHADPRQGEHPDWGTLIFNYGRNEVANFLIGSALYFLKEFHVDGLRVDAVASMLYLDYSRDDGGWVPNVHGGRENLEAIDFIRRLNRVIGERCPGCYAIAEESTAWGGVTGSVEHGGLGFALKWNMGWMHDTLKYFALDPVHRRYHQNDLTFASVYEQSERFIMPLSHDEVVHGKGSLLQKMPGDRWRKFANLRTLFAYQYTRPGKKLLFMGSEFAQEYEWNYAESLPWPDPHDEERQAFMRFMADVGQLYLKYPALHGGDLRGDSFRWIDTSDHDQSVLSYERCVGAQRVLVVLNLTPVPRPGYRIGSQYAGSYTLLLSSDDRRYGGSDCAVTRQANTEPIAMHGCEHSVGLDLPPLGALVLLHHESELSRRARGLGIEDAYYTIDGTRHLTSERTRAALVRALGSQGATDLGALQDEQSEPLGTAYSAVEALGDARVAGVWTQLYTLRGASSWGIGDFTDLQQLLRICAAAGLDFVGLNPLHATPLHAQPAIPYHPTSRLFDSPLYIALPAVPEYAAHVDLYGTPDWLPARLEGVSARDVIDYPSVWALKRDALRLAFAIFSSLDEDNSRRRALATFEAERGPALQRFATFCAIQESLWEAGQPCYDSAGFPEAYRDADGAGVAAFAEEHAEDVAFFVYLQFLADEQLERCQALARELGMRVGLYLDLAVGAGHGGFDGWQFPELYVCDASLGAPPDQMAPQGQDWGIVPLHPLNIQNDGFAHVRELLRHSMRHAGALRIDHAMWLARQFWIPHEDGAAGTYVRFPLDALLQVLVEESRRTSCLIIGEDLGTVPPGFREALEERAVLRYEVLHFSRDEHGNFWPPEGFSAQALLCLSTHDVPTFGEYLSGDDLLLRRRLGVISEESLLAQVERRVQDRGRLLRWLAEHGKPMPQGAESEAVLAAVHALLASAKSRMLALSLDDLTGEPFSVNVPGTRAEDGFVSFARRMARSLDALQADEELIAALRELSLRKDLPAEAAEDSGGEDA